jgi:hypothetical protein
MNDWLTLKELAKMEIETTVGRLATKCQTSTTTLPYVAARGQAKEKMMITTFTQGITDDKN